MKSFRLHGLTLTSDFPFVTPLPESSLPGELALRCHPPARSPFTDLRGSPLYRSPLQTNTAESVSSLYRVDGSPLLYFAGVGDFHCPPGRIEVYPLPGCADVWLELRLLGAVLPFLLESRGTPTLHASAIEVGGRCLAFLSGNGGGKTSLAAAGLAAGASLLTDDLLAIHSVNGRCIGQPGFPQMRMWPQLADHFLPDIGHLEPVLPELDKRRVPIGPGGLGRFQSRPQTLAGLYLAERRAETGGGIHIEPVGPARALMQLVRHSFTPYVVEALGWQKRRLTSFERMLDTVPVKTLSYPSGFEHLPGVVERVLVDLYA